MAQQGLDQKSGGLAGSPLHVNPCGASWPGPGLPGPLGCGHQGPVPPPFRIRKRISGSALQKPRELPLQKCLLTWRSRFLHRGTPRRARSPDACFTPQESENWLLQPTPGVAAARASPDLRLQCAVGFPSCGRNCSA